MGCLSSKIYLRVTRNVKYDPNKDLAKNLIGATEREPWLQKDSYKLRQIVLHHSTRSADSVS